nr:MAG: major capsid protein [Microviridae sp.]
MKNQARDFGHDRPIEFPKGSFFLSQSRQGSYDMGLLYPVYATELLPGDRTKIQNTMNLAFTETLSAIRHEVNAVIDWYFMPYGAMANITAAEAVQIGTMSNSEKMAYYDPRYGFRNNFWQQLITGGFDGQNVDTLQGYTPVASDLNPGSLWDHFGLPMTIAPADYAVNKINIGLWRTYEAIYNWNYRDENWQSAYSPTGATVTVAGDPSMSIQSTLNSVINSDWEKDYFTTALKSQQRGPATAVNVTGIAQAIYSAAVAGTVSSANINSNNDNASLQNTNGTNQVILSANATSNGAMHTTAQAASIPAANLNANTVTLSGIGIDISKLRLAVATQRVLERNSRAGARESEFYKAHYGVGPTDTRGDRPQFIGRYKQPITFSDVTNVSVNGTPAANTAPTIATQTMGHRQSRGDATGAGFIGEFDCKEFGILMAVMTIRPRSMYYQKTEKYWFSGRGRWDFPMPEFANLSEQAVMTRELAPDTVASVGQVFGYQGRFDEYRQKVNDAVGLLRPTGATGGTANLRSWNLGRNFTGTPVQGDTFLRVDPNTIKGANFVYTTTDIPMLIGTIGNIVEVSGRPIPQVAQPGLMDHI